MCGRGVGGVCGITIQRLLKPHFSLTDLSRLPHRLGGSVPSLMRAAASVLTAAIAITIYMMGDVASRLLRFLYPSPTPALPDALKIGILGAAQINTFGILLPSRALAEVTVVAIGARDVIRAKRVAERWGIPSHGDYHTVLADPEVEVRTPDCCSVTLIQNCM